MAAKSYWGYRAHQLEIWKASLAVTPEQLERRPAFVLEHERVIGFYSLHRRNTHCELDNFWIRPEQMGRGYGRQLLEHAKATARDLGASELTIDSDPNAERFYVHCGAVVVGHVAAPINGQPDRRRPQLRLPVAS
jgi:GNAT superfamily N-acetyltransferase